MTWFHYRKIELTDEDLDRLSDEIPGSNYDRICFESGESYDSGQTILTTHSGNLKTALREVLQKWFNRTEPRNRLHNLKGIMTRADLLGKFQELFQDR